MEERASLKNYCVVLGRHLINIYSLLSWVIAVAGVLPIWSGQRLLWLTALFAVLSIVPSSFWAWKDAVNAQPRPAEIFFSIKSVKFSASDGRIPKMGKLDIRVDVTNPAAEPVHIVGITAESWVAPGELFPGTGKVEIHGNVRPGIWERLTFPIKLDPLDRRTDLGIFVEIQTNSDPDVEFARRVTGLKGFEMKLAIRSENPARVESVAVVEVSGTFDSFKAELINRWMSNKTTDLLVAAGNLDRIEGVVAC